jgi:diketogulonate reductase-like aldo/keto reductase
MGIDMNTRELGKTGVRLPIIGLGTWRYRGGVEPLRVGLALGARFIDTAESYGTEDVVGQAIHGSRKDIFLATKVSPRHFRYANVLRSADDSLKRLRTDYIDLYQLHWPNHTIAIEETMGAMEQLVNQGKIRFIGVSNFMLADLRNAQRAMTKHRIVANQVRYNLIDRTIELGLLRYCNAQDITVIAHSPLACDLPSIRARDSEDVLGKLAQANSRTVAQIALNWCLSKQGVVAIPKANSAEHVRENGSAGDFHLSPQELQLLDTRVRFEQRSPTEIMLRRFARLLLQVTGRCQ